MTDTTKTKPRPSGLKVVLVTVYAILGLAATGRSVFQLIKALPDATLANWLSAVAAVIYLVATVALIGKSAFWRSVAIGAIVIELIGVLVVGTISILAPQVLGQATTQITGDGASVWSVFGMGYGFIPLILPILGLLWLFRSKHAKI